MAARTDTKWLERHGGKWRVTYSVPRNLHSQLGTRLKYPLHTDSLAVANRLKLAVVADFREQIAALQRSPIENEVALRREAMRMRRYRRAAQSEHEEREVLAAIEDRAHDVLGAETSVEFFPETGQWFPIYDNAKELAANTFLAIGATDKTPIRLHYDSYLSSIAKLNKRTIADDRRAVRFLADFVAREDIEDEVGAITTRIAKRFAGQLGRQAGNILPRTQQKYITRLSRYWAYLLYHECVDLNPWTSVVVEIEETPHEQQERAFTDEEVRRLLLGPATQRMRDVMLIGALTGARLDAIVDLSVGDVLDGGFSFKKQKRETSGRDVPVHPSLQEIVERRCTGKKSTDEFFPEWKPPRDPNSQRERSFKASNEFTAYRRLCGVDHIVSGRRRSLVNYHSFRRWFITRAEQAKVDTNLLAAIVGHKRSGMTLSKYSEGPEFSEALDAVSQVKLPPLFEGPIPDRRTVIQRKGSVGR